MGDQLWRQPWYSLWIYTVPSFSNLKDAKVKDQSIGNYIPMFRFLVFFFLSFSH